MDPIILQHWNAQKYHREGDRESQMQYGGDLMPSFEGQAV